MSTARRLPAANEPSAVWRWGLIVLAILPFQLLLVQHLASSGATGFLQYDSPYYVANGRAVFERGNGFAGPNPYDPSPSAPAIYFQWLTWLFGFGVKVLGLDPGVAFATIGLIAALAGSALTLRLVETVLPERQWRGWLFLATMWGGGLLCAGAGVVEAVQGRASAEGWLRFDPGGGWWFLNWGRNFVLPTEAVYHALTAAMWLGVLRRRWGLALGAAGALAATHPFSGLEQLLILLVWCAALAGRERTGAMVRNCAIAAAMLAAFAAYYFWFLDGYPSHRALRAAWTIDWPVTVGTIALASGPVAAVAAWRLWRERGRWDEQEKFLLTAFAVVLLLMKHDWFIAARQPVHFARGYNWLPLWLIALPQLQAWLQHAWTARWRVGMMGGAAILAAFAGWDNAVFLAVEWRHGAAERQVLTANQREVLAWMDHAQLRGVLLCADPRVSYLAATYTGVRPYYGHVHNTPGIWQRRSEVGAWRWRGQGGSWLAQIDYVLIERAKPPAQFDAAPWRELHRNPDYILVARTR